MTQGFAVVAAEVGKPEQVAIVRHFANIDFIVDGYISAIDKAVVRAFVGLIVDGRSLSGRAFTTKQRF